MRVVITTLLFVLLGWPAYAESVDETLVRVRGKYPSMVTAVQAAAILNETAWVHRTEGWAILGKPGGTNCPQPTTAVPISCDYLIHQVNGVWWGWDALIATGKPGAPGPATPNTPIGQGENMTDAITSGARSVVQAVDPGTEPPPPPPDDDLAKQVAALEAAVSRLEQEQKVQNLNLAALASRVTALEEKPAPAPPVVTCEEIKTSTGRTWGHGHPVTVWKCEVK
jgi:hypothetical protein